MKQLVTKSVIVAAVVLAMDQVAKTIARSTLETCVSPPFAACEQVDFGGAIGLARLENAGSAMGFEEGLSIWVLLALAGLVLIPVYAQRLAPLGGIAAVAVGLQAGGALGNLLDRLFLGGVTDFIVIGRAFVINPADIALVAGMVIASVLMLRAPAMCPSGLPRA